MRCSFVSLWLLQCLAVQAARAPPSQRQALTSQKVTRYGRSDGAVTTIVPRLFILSMFKPEQDVWFTPQSGIGGLNVTLPGLSPLFPDVHCDELGYVCQLTTGEGEINAAATVMALWLSPLFNLTQTYFLIAGIGGINPSCGTTGSVAFSRYAVQVALQYEIDIRDLPSNYSSGYVPLGTTAPLTYPQNIYGSEVFELNAKLQQRAINLTSGIALADTALAQTFRAQYPPGLPASRPPAVFAGDTATSDVYFSGPHLTDAFANFSALITNSSARYCISAQEDNASLEALLRGARAARLDFARIILMRTASDFDRPPPNVTTAQNLFFESSGGYPSSKANIYNAGIVILNDVMNNWDALYAPGIAADNYVGDIYDSLTESIAPDFGNPADYGSGSLNS